ncbi:LPXTG cell wall anchor domain-containing protein [Lipingzhangella sp. LS1_29]|uniref:LPXTG cell wall anchor domain-containing protein n=1 Tax=Lipingzhangella rawalii TaxID=2055835 RepID=A0ABU2H3C8_9ACTN|nr:LPXTG cell wall anchor domain-containing protein [Lipingzhangella rawalii]MDS1269806.1 LPXTG cell wall anchor domain-containing protein [Lipingzhangella rawalii]
MVPKLPGRAVATGLAAMLVPAPLAALVLPAHAEEVTTSYECHGPGAPDAAELSLAPLRGLDSVQVDEEVDVALRVRGAEFPEEESEALDGTVSAMEVRSDLLIGGGTEVVQVSGNPDPDQDSWVLGGELRVTEEGTYTVEPGDLQITQVVIPPDTRAESGSTDPPAQHPTPSDSPTATPSDSPTATPSPLDTGEQAALSAPGDSEAAHETVVTECVVTETSADLGALEVVDAGDAADPSPGESPTPQSDPSPTPRTDPEVTTDGGFVWFGDWACTSDAPDRLDSFTGPGSASASLETDLVVGAASEANAEFSFADMPVRDARIGAGDMSATLTVAVSGAAAADTELVFTTTNSTDVTAADEWIEFEILEPRPVTPQQPGELQLELEQLVLTTELDDGAGAVTHICLPDGALPAPDTESGNTDGEGQDQDNGGLGTPGPGDRPERDDTTGDTVSLPLTGSSIAGLATAAILALLAGSTAVMLGRRRDSSADLP